MREIPAAFLKLDHFGEALRLAKDRMNEKNVYYMNPAFDK